MCASDPGRLDQAQQVCGGGPRQKMLPSPPGWELCSGPTTLLRGVAVTLCSPWEFRGIVVLIKSAWYAKHKFKILIVFVLCSFLFLCY